MLTLALTALAMPVSDNVDWTLQHGLLARNELVADQIELEDGSFLTVGTFIDANDEGIYVAKVSRQGGLKWELHLQNSASADRGRTAVPLNDGGAVIVGTLSTASPGSASLHVPWLLRVGSAGNVIWDSRDTFTPTLDIDCSTLQAGVLPGGRIVAVGASAQYATFEQRYVLTVAPNGELVSLDDFDPIIGGWYSYTLMTDAAATSDGGFVISGSTGPYPAYPFLWRFGPNGAEQWLQVYQGAEFARTAQSVNECADGSLLMTGIAQGSPQPTALLRAESDGSLRWARRINAPHGQYSQGVSAIERQDGQILLLEQLTDAVAAQDVSSDLVRLTADGTVLERIPLPGGSFGTSMVKIFVFDGSSPEGYLLTGARNDLGPCQPQDLWIIGKDVPQGAPFSVRD